MMEMPFFAVGIEVYPLEETLAGEAAFEVQQIEEELRLLARLL